ncbi:hypothetical protein DUNSADRAFT_14266 [Dunaliella salina]|uniref:AAA+ ATPase domain-containing protein n=1 Tax=Dunaliella salina TaxID=3046 RepID=A0ABQ7G7Q7_DUNSA|nr:hypothetical protein DUNSADRAFT_14266 [Dunaliella salina]|eukprot:KAF5830619.1 hypothetical protein DUNSADRAFT_14266 [Dunaliella salina]
MADSKRIEWIREKIEHGLGVDGSLFDELSERQGGTIASYLDGDGDMASSALIFSLEQATVMVEPQPRQEEEPDEQAKEEGPGEGEQGNAETSAEPGSQPDAAPSPEASEAQGGHQNEGTGAPSHEASPEQKQQEQQPRQQDQPQQEHGPGSEQQRRGEQEEGQQQEGAEKGEGGDVQNEEGGDEEPPPPPPPPPPQIVKVSVPKLVSRLHLSCGFIPDELSHMLSLYFIRGKPGKLQFEDLDEALECGVLNERPSLRNLEQTLASVYMPMLIQITGADMSKAGVLLSSGASNSHKDLLSNMQKFLSQVSHALQQLNGDVTLEVPDVPIDSVEKAAADTELVMSLEQYMSEWSTTLASVMQQESERQPSGSGPLAEIEFWRLRNAILSALYEQLNLPSVQKIIAVLEIGSDDRNLMASFKSQLAELTKLAAEARDNVKFLTTLERHFKNIAGGPLNGILDTLPPMMNALRMVWIISRHYSDDQRMGSLFQRIAQEIGDRVENAIDLTQIFRVPPQEALTLIKACKSVLEHWYMRYMEVREKIEKSERDARWEFPKQLLFARTNYMAEICNDLIEMVEIVDDFFMFLGPELKASATRELIDTSFRKLRSAEGACELLQNFKHIKSKGAIQKQVINKFNDILEQFAREIDQTTTIFEENKHAPPVTKNQPPIAGAIKWARALLARLKQTMIKLHSTEEEIIRTTEIGCNVESKFRSFAKAVMFYEKKLFSTWSDSINTITMQHLKQPIFIKSSVTGRVEVNFHTDLIELIRETRYLDRMGFPIPEIALNVALQEVKYHQWLESLQHMLEHYYEVIEQLSPIERELMAKKLSELESCLHAGFHTLNWNSLGIPEFIQACRRAINSFLQVVKQVQKNSGIIEQVVHAITAANIVCEPPADAEIMDLQEFYELIEKHRLESTDRLVKKYRNISPLLGKIEEVVAGTNTGKSPQLAGYYAYWERAIFNALNAMVSHAMNNLQTMIDSRSKRVQMAKAKAAGEDPSHAHLRKLPPLFKVSVSLQNTDIIIQPPVNEVNKALGRLVRSLVESTKAFVRWMDGTCIETAEQKGKDEDEPVLFTFYWDVAANPQVIKSMLQLNQSIQATIEGVNRYIKSWQRHHSLWKTDKSSVLDKFKSKEPSCAAFEEKLMKYSKMAQDIAALPKDYDQDFIRVSSHALIASVEEEALGWVRAISHTMYELDVVTLQQLKDRISSAQPPSHIIACDISQVRHLWAALADEADEVDWRLEDTKKLFSETTRQQVSDFQEYTSQMWERFKTAGPGVPTIELTQGLELLHQFQSELDSACKAREQLVLAERLFDMDITSYPCLGQLENEMKKLQQVYAVYQEHVDSVRQYACMLWSELDVASMMAGTDEVAQKLRKLKHLRLLPVYDLVEKDIQGFFNSLPLMKELKSEALREHMRPSGPLGVVVPTFPTAHTLCLVKELTIENEIKKLTDVWREQRFELGKYMKGLEDRGWVLRQTEEITVLLEDMGLNLQSMLASPFVRPFLTETLAEQLEICQKSLSEYLDTKRCAFPRFFFISDDELLSILGTSDPTSVQEHMLKLFDNCAALRFGRGNKSIIGMTSSEKEAFSFQAPVAIEGAVESWMSKVEAEMRATLYHISKEGVFYYAKSARTTWIKENLGMVTLVGSQIWWTWETEDVFRRVRDGKKHAMKDFAAKLTGQLSELTAMVRSDLSDEVRRKVNTLIIIDVHARDIVDTFVRDSIMDAREFAWESQLRFYWDRFADDIDIRQCSGQFKYGYEYMGLNGRLVITALTDRCCMTLTTALNYRLGGAPAGPAGTGKTETTKDLAKSMALLCVVFNCGEGLDYKAMGSIFSGLVQCGAWGCFDEFNRIEAEEGLKNMLPKFQFEGKEITLDPRTGIFITMNPGYAGRTELPDNLKALFRPVTMVVPDMEQICEIMLFSEGFDSAKLLAKKMTVLYNLSKEQLSKQHHYDFGLRALKSVLVMAGSLKRGAPDMSEHLVLMRALRDMNLPKFVYDDVPLFLGLVNDLFPGMDCPRVRYPQFNDTVENELAEQGYQVLTGSSEQVDKVIQLYEVMMTRHTTMVVGQTRGGKTVIINTLARAQTKMGKKTTLHTINPKAITVSELYGVLDPDTRDWTDGLLSNIFREINKPLPPEKDEARYLIFDGDVDAVWVENMNSVMDDNKLLTLPNGERIRLQNHCKLLFEVFDLQYASPATISRCGMVYVDSRNLGYKPYVWKWLNTRKDSEVDVLRLLFEKYAYPCVDWVIEGIDGDDLVRKPKLTVGVTNLNMIAQLCHLLNIVTADNPRMSDPQLMEATFVFCVVWSIGATIVQRSDANDRDRFDQFIKTRLSNTGMVDGERVSAAQLPAKSLYEYCFDVDEGVWKAWKSYVTPYVPPADNQFSKILVPTVDVVRTTWLLHTIVSNGKPILLVGESGTAKSVTINKYLGSLDPGVNLVLNMNFSSRTSSLDVQRAAEDSTEKRTKDTYGPPMGKRLIMFIDDLNMPRVDLYGTQQPIAFLKLFIERKGMYDRGKDLSWKNVKDVQVVAAMGPPGGARNPVDPRFMSLFNIFEVQFPSSENLSTIYQAILSTHLNKLPGEGIRELIGEKLTEATVSLYNFICEKLPPTPSRFHYVFNLRDISRVYEGLLLSTPDKFHNAEQFLRLWRNEALRVFHDRLICPEDKQMVNSQITEVVEQYFEPCAAHTLADPILFGDYSEAVACLTGEANDSMRLYEDLGTYSNIKPIFERILELYNAKHKRMNLVNNTVIDWFEPWPEQALQSVASVFLAEEVLPEDLRPQIVEHMITVHQSVRTFSARFQEELRRYNYVTPKNYLDFINNYKRALASNRKEVDDMTQRLSGGLQKLEQAALEVDAMQKELSEAKVVVEYATRECNQLLEVISTNTAEVETKAKAAVEKEAQLKVDSENIQVEKADAEAALEEAIPALEEAAAALQDLRREDITEIRSFAKPHVLVQKVCECVVILRGLKDVSWAGAKAMMSDSNFLKSLVDFDKDSLSEKQVKKVKEYMKGPSFTYESLKGISTAGAGLLKWVLAMVNYNNVAKTVEPKRKKVAEAEKNLRMAQKDLANTKQQLQDLNTQLSTLRAQFEEKTAEQQDLKAKADLMERRLTAASRLIAGLGSERSRWNSDIEELERRKVCGEVRLESLLTTDVETTIWSSEGLPSDELSVQNGILTVRANRWPLCIDPQMQAVNWIKIREGKQLEGKVKTFNDADFLKQLELAIQYGFPFLFENLDEYIDPVIDTVLEKNFLPSPSGKQVIRLGDKEVEWDPNFRLYMTSKQSNPHYGPEVSGKTMIINYGVTQQGLTEQLLNVTVKHERSDLEEARESLVKEMSDNKALLKNLEDTLLRELSNATGNILDNQELISTLESAKAKAVEIAEKLEASKVMAGHIEEARVRYSPVAQRGAILFFVMDSLSAISNMYEYSLGSFLSVFNQTLNTSKKDVILENRLHNVIEALTFDIYSYTCLGLFEKHKLMFSFQMTIKILEGETPLDSNFIDFFLKGNLSLEKARRLKPYEWLPDQGWQDLTRLVQIGSSKLNASGKVHPLARLADDIEADEAIWREFYEQEAPEEAPLPMGYDHTLSEFEKLCVLRCLRVDRITVAITRFVVKVMAERYVQPPVVYFSSIYRQSTAATPIVFVLSPELPPAAQVAEDAGEDPGEDPTAAPRLPTVADHRAHRNLPPGCAAAQSQGRHRASQWAQAQHAAELQQNHVDETIPWGTLRYLIGEAMYGGRVSDSFDRRILTTYLDEYMGDFLFDTFQPFSFYQHKDVNISVPPTGPRELYVQAIDSLPLVQTPEIFGLHSNADISYYTNATKAIWADLMDLQPRTGGAGAGVSREDFIAGVARDIQSKIPQRFDLPLLKKEIGVPSPTQVVLLQELERWNNVLVVMSQSLRDLQRALVGDIGFSSALEELSTSLFNGKLPVMWARLARRNAMGVGLVFEADLASQEHPSHWVLQGVALVQNTD